MEISKDIKYVGASTHKIDLFEGQFAVPNGMSYNSYVILDEKIAIIDTVDASVKDEWLEKIKNVLGEKTPTYLIVEHMEPDHSANIKALTDVYPEITIVSSALAIKMMGQFFGTEFKNKIIVKDSDTLSLGKHNLEFISAPFVHWPEVLFVFDTQENVLFSADAFGKFGALDTDEEWDCEARRYYFGIVGKFGTQVQQVLRKLNDKKISTICPLHGPILTDLIPNALKQYQTWSSYEPETNGVFIAYTSVYGNTKNAVNFLYNELKNEKVAISDLSRCDMSEAIEDAFRYDKIILATTTYNGGIFPAMRIFLEELVERNFQNRKVAIIDNGSWAPAVSKTIKTLLEPCKNIEYIEPEIKILSSMTEKNIQEIKTLAEKLK